MSRKLRIGIALGALLLGSIASVRVYAGARSHHIGHGHGFSHVLLISVDGMHALDYINCVNGGYCKNLATLGHNAVNYLDTSASKPSDSFPGLTALVTGGSPRTTGVNYDIAYDRDLNPPLDTTGNGLLGTSAMTPSTTCKPGSPTGTSTEYEEGININGGVDTGKADQLFLNGGALSGDGGINSIDSTRLVRDANCLPVYPWNFLRVNTIYGAIHGAGGYTAWSDKHPSYSSVGGPTGTSTDSNLDDYYSPEINSKAANFEVAAPLQLVIPQCLKNGVPHLLDQAAKSDDYTGSFDNVKCYDGLKVMAVLNEIDGMNHDGTAPAPVPNIFGMNFQAVSIGQKLIYQHGMPVGQPKGGYLDSIGTPTASLKGEIEFIDSSIGQMVAELKKQGLSEETLVIITAKHGQSPVDSSRYVPDGSNDPVSILAACLPDSEVNQSGPTEDDVALIWVDQNLCKTSDAVKTLETMSPASNNIAGIGEIFSGPSIGLYYNAGDSRAPDILVTPNIGVTYSNSTKKLAEHGGFAHDDVNVIMLVANPNFQGSTITSPVETSQVAPTILKALGLDPNSLQAVQQEGTKVLPGLSL